MDNIKRGKKGKASKYDLAFRRKLIAELLTGTITKTELCHKYNIDRGHLRRWLLWHQQQQDTAVLSSQVMAQTEQDTGHQVPEDSSATIKELQERLRKAELKVFCLETLIDQTEQDLSIDIRKNAGTRSSKE